MPTTPFYQRVADDLRRRIQAGEWAEGEQLPTQDQLAEHYRMSLQPIKTALMRLELEGVLYTHQGKGTFVGRRPAEDDPIRPDG
jgi:DNA-binding GntR family transcriptional regulator